MSIELPASFGYRVSNLVLRLDQYEAATSTAEREQLMREALTMACNAFADLDLKQLESDLATLLGPPDSVARINAAAILRRTDLYDLFERMEEQMLDRAGFTFPARDRILQLLAVLRLEAAEDVAQVEAQQLTGAIDELRRWVCEYRERWVEAAVDAGDRADRNEAHTRLINSLGTATIVTNTAVGLAGVASVLFLPVISAAACAASAALGGIAVRMKARKPELAEPTAGGESGVALRWPPDSWDPARFRLKPRPRKPGG
jgi:hypothetical protein